MAATGRDAQALEGTTPPVPASRSSAAERAFAGALPIAAVACAALFAASWCFSQFAGYDDQGYMMLVVRQLLDGRAPYVEIAVPYGPFYLFQRWIEHTLLGVPLSTDAVRWLTVAHWTTVALLVAWSVARALEPLRQRWLWASLAALVSTLQLRDTALEPGHPQETYLLAVACAWCASSRSAAGPRRRAFGWGALVGLLGCVKVNLGVLAGAAWLCIVASSSRSRGLRLVPVAIAVALPLGLMRGNLEKPWVLALCANAVLALLALAVQSVPVRAGSGAGSAHPGSFALGLVGAASLGLGFALLRGATPGALVEELLLAPLRFASTFEVAFMPRTAGLVVTALGLLCACAFAWGSPVLGERLRARLLAWMQLAYLGLIVVAAGGFVPLEHGGWLRFEYGAGFAWVLAFPCGADPDGRVARLCRGVLWFSLFERLQAYPVAGAQVAVGELGFCFVAIVVAARALAHGLAFRPQRTWIAHAWAPLLLLAAGRSAVAESLENARLMAHFVPLDLPGARLLHVPRGQATVARWLAHNLDACSSTFVSTISFNSLYFWSSKPPPSSVLIGQSLNLVSSARQEQVVRALRASDAPWVVDHTGIFPAAVPGEHPLLDYARRELHLVASSGNYRLWARTQAPALVDCAWRVGADELPPALRALDADARDVWFELAPVDGEPPATALELADALTRDGAGGRALARLLDAAASCLARDGRQLMAAERRGARLGSPCCRGAHGARAVLPHPHVRRRRGTALGDARRRRGAR